MNMKRLIIFHRCIIQSLLTGVFVSLSSCATEQATTQSVTQHRDGSSTVTTVPYDPCAEARAEAVRNLFPPRR